MAFKMKGNPMQRNFGIPIKKKPGYNPGGKKLPAAEMEEIKKIDVHGDIQSDMFDEDGFFSEKHKKAKTLKTK